ncbi:terpene synthase family protein [Streptomyces sp. NPDC059989]|uniref:terpene synthase family protein n=1 Tax=Streptomyces sp. NPDC059989 TaxID=3347026 RepID=UPI003679359B
MTDRDIRRTVPSAWHLDRDLPAGVSADAAASMIELHALLGDAVRGLQPHFRRDLLLECTMTAVFTAPWIRPQDLLPAARLACWIVVIDDHADTAAADTDEVDATFDSCRNVLNGAGPVTGNPIADALASILHSLAQLPSHDLLGPPLRASLHRMLDAMSIEYRASRRHGQEARPFGTQEYFTIAADSIGVLPLMTTLWHVMDAPDLPRHLPLLTDAAQHASLAVRVANDLAGTEREHAEGKINALSLGFSRSHLHTELANAQQNLQKICQPLIDNGNAPAIALTRFTTWAVRLYQHQGLPSTSSPA